VSKLTPEQQEQAFLACRADPVLFAEEVVGDELWPVQAEIARAVRDYPRVVVPSCHSSGKTHISARIALWGLVCFRGLVLTLAPTYRQVRDALWREIRIAYRRTQRRWALTGNLLPVESRLTLDDDWFMFGFATDRPVNLQGIHAKRLLIVVDEAPGIERDMWEPLETLMAGGESRLLAIGNPVEPSGPFFDMCRDPKCHRINISAFDTPNLTAFGIRPEHVEDGSWESMIAGPLPFPSLITPQWVAERHRKWGPNSPMYLSRVLGEFPQSATDALIPLSWVDRAQQAELEPGEPCVLGVDVARFGDAETVAMLRRGQVARLAFTSSQEDTMQTAGRIANAIRQHGPSACYVDEIGVGAGVVDRLRELHLPCRVLGLNSGERPNDTEQFANSRAEWWWSLRERFEEGEVSIPDDDELAAQLTGLKFRYTSRGQVLIESKEDMRKRGLPSPDRADALMLAFAANMPSGEIIRPGRRPHPKLSPGQAWLEDIGGDDKPKRKRGWM
jgi:hypothetical protein